MSRASCVMRRVLPFVAAWAVAAAGPPPTERLVTVTQKDRAFGVRDIQMERGGTVRFINEDDFPHQINVRGNGLNTESGLQGPGETIEVALPLVGDFAVRCGIHPRMRMTIHAL